MLMRLKTVRAKLTALVSLPVVVTLASMPVLSWMLQRQLVDEAGNRVVNAQKAFREEFKDSLLDLRLAADLIAADSDTQRAMNGAVSGTREAALRDIGDDFLKVYPEIDILFLDAQGKVLAQLGCLHPPPDVGGMEEIRPVLSGKEVNGITAHGCESHAGASPAYLIATPVKGGGAVVVCLPITRAYLDNAGQKFGLRLAVYKTGAETALETSSNFPNGVVPTALDTPALKDEGDRAWVGLRWEPTTMVGPKDSYAVAAALDVTDFRSIVRWNLAKVALVLFAAACVSVFMGWRLASIMSGALRRVNDALKKLALQEYVHVEPVNTGDELEDLATGFNLMVDGLKERDNLRTTMGKYMTASVMEHLLSGQMHLGGASIKVTILFTDIRSFTSISEKMDAQQLVGLLNEYFTEMVGIVMQENGVVDKYIGDALMAVFGAPVPREDDAVNAVKAAVRMRVALAHLNVKLIERGLAPLRTGIGVHTGEVIAGNIGSEKRMEYTVIGDAVNLASRLESGTKSLGVNILISEDTYQLVKHEIEARQVKEITVKGRAQPVMAYEVLGIKGEALLPVSDSSKLLRASQRPPELVVKRALESES